MEEVVFSYIWINFLDRLTQQYRNCTDGASILFVLVRPRPAKRAMDEDGTCRLDQSWWQIDLRPCLDPTQNPKFFKIPRHIKSCGTCMEH